MKKTIKILTTVTFNISLMAQFNNLNTEQLKIRGQETWRTHLSNPIPNTNPSEIIIKEDKNPIRKQSTLTSSNIKPEEVKLEEGSPARGYSTYTNSNSVPSEIIIKEDGTPARTYPTRLTATNTKPLIPNIKEYIDLYYTPERNDIVVQNDWKETKSQWRMLVQFNLGGLNPTYFKKIAFLGNNFYSKISWGSESNFGSKLNEIAKTNNNNEIRKKMLNAKIFPPYNDVSRYLKPENMFVVQEWPQQRYGISAYIEATQLFALTWYYENGSYYVQVFSYHWVYVTGSNIGGATWMEIGKGIKLYNENESDK